MTTCIPFFDTLILDNLRLVPWCLKRWQDQFRHLSWDDRESIATLALVKAATYFDGGMRIRFSTFATTCIYRALLRESKKVKPMISLTVMIDGGYDVPARGESERDVEIVDRIVRRRLRKRESVKSIARSLRLDVDYVRMVRAEMRR